MRTLFRLFDLIADSYFKKGLNLTYGNPPALYFG